MFSLLLAGGLASAQSPAPPSRLLLPPPALPASLGGAQGSVVPTAAPSTADQDLGYLGSIEPPSPERLFQLESEASVKIRWQNDERQRGRFQPLTFPEEPVLSKEPYLGRAWNQRTVMAEPNFVCYGRLFFEQPNDERYGWDLGVVSPVVETGAFFFDVAALPYHLATDPCRNYESSAGYCLPGDPVPYLLYPPERSATGALAEAAAIGTLLAVFP